MRHYTSLFILELHVALHGGCCNLYYESHSQNNNARDLLERLFQAISSYSDKAVRTVRNPPSSWLKGRSLSHVISLVYHSMYCTNQLAYKVSKQIVMFEITLANPSSTINNYSRPSCFRNYKTRLSSLSLVVHLGQDIRGDMSARKLDWPMGIPPRILR
jgi:hypothetical protein